MKLPNFEQAVVDIAKLRDYCLNPEHEEGRHKARVFKSALGITLDNAEILQDALLNAGQTYEAVPSTQTKDGQFYVIEFQMKVASKEAIVRSVWLVEADKDYPRLITCFVKKSKRRQNGKTNKTT